MDKSNNKLILISNSFLYILPILGVLGVTIPLIIGKSNFSLLGTYLAIPMILAPVVYVKHRRNEINLVTYNQRLFPLYVFLYFICIFLSICVLHIYDIRPVVYYLITAIISGLIILEILLFDMSEKKVIIVLLQLMILSADIIWAVTLKYHLFIGRTDPLAHMWLIQNLINYSHVTEVFGIYRPFPLWHILCTSMYLVLGSPLTIKKMMFFTNGLIYLFVPIMTYLISMKLFKDTKISLLSALFISLYPDVMYYGMSSISRSVVSFLELMLILVLLDPNKPKKVFLTIILSISIIVYHTASAPFLISILLAIYILKRINTQEKNESFLPFNFIILTISITLFYWIYYARQLFETLVKLILTETPVGTITKSVFYTPLNELFNYLQYSPLLFFVIIGFFAITQSKKVSALEKVFCIFGFLAVALTFPGPGLLLNRLAHNFNIERFGEYTFLFIGLTGAIGFHEIFNKSRKYTRVFLVLLFISMTFLSISNDFNASDNPLIKRPFYTFYLTDEEETVFTHVASISQGFIMSDYVTTRYLSYSKFENKTNMLEVDSKNNKFLINQTNDIFLIRNSELKKRPLELYSTSGEEFVVDPSWEGNVNYYYQDSILWNDLAEKNKIYDSESVTGFY